MKVRVATFKAKANPDIDKLHAARDDGIYATKSQPGLRFRHFFGFKDANGQQWGGSITIWDDPSDGSDYESDGDTKLKGHWSDADFQGQRDGNVKVNVFDI
jgi:hypothetical protein